MLTRLKDFFFRFNIDLDKEPVLLAASAGVDSTVLCHLLHQAGCPLALGHCNFSLRGKESDEDELFLIQLADQLGIPVHTTRFDTIEYAASQKVSIQMAARQLRYEWLENKRRELSFSWIATAHHADDNIETVLLNFTRETGIKGIRGIQEVTGNVIRPLLRVAKKDILRYADENGISYRNDQSNESIKYTRNLIRHRVIPVLESINPAFTQSATRTIQNLVEVEKLAQFALEEIKSRIFSRENLPSGALQWKIDIQQLLHYPAPATILLDILKPFDFNADQCLQIVDHLDQQPGGQFFSDRYVLLQDRFYLILELKENIGGVILISGIEASPVQLPGGGTLTFCIQEHPPESFSRETDTAWLDLQQIKWPLKVRRWNPGDQFQPLGMKGRHRKLQDMFSDLKLSRFEKEKVWIVESGNDICWIAGIRLDERFKVTDSTKKCLVVKFLPDV